MKRHFGLIALDLDGTVYTDEKKITEATINALSEVSKRGVRICAATGRLFRDIPEEVKALPGFSYGIACNGAAVFDREGRPVDQDLLAFEEYGELLKAMADKGMIVDAFSLDHIYRDRRDRDKVAGLNILESMKQFMLRSREDVEDLSAFLSEKRLSLCKLTANFPEGDAQREALDMIMRNYPRFVSVSGGYGNREITKQSATKGAALLRLAESLGMPAKETMAMGDSENDLDMIRKAGCGVAMGNAAPEVKAVSDYVTKTNEEDGVAFALRELVL